MREYFSHVLFSVESFSCDISLLTFSFCFCSLVAIALSSLRLLVSFDALSVVLLALR